MQTYAVAETVDYQGQQEAIAWLDQATNGRIKITLYLSGALVGYADMLEALGAGTFEVAFNVVSFFSGLDPGFSAICGIPGIDRTPRDVRIWFDPFGGNEIYRDAYLDYNVYFVRPTILGAEGLFTKRPIRTLEDIQGLKVRTAPGLSHELFVKLGASPQSLPGSELYTALDTGLIDAAEFVSLTTNYDMGLHEVTEAVLYPSFHAPTFNSDVSVNLDAWNELPDDLKAIMEAFAQRVSDNYNYWGAAADYETLNELKNAGMEIADLSDEDKQTITELGILGAEDWRSKSELSDRVIGSWFDYMRFIGKMD
jgi:TRAP-type mannitol/chloroaromatic compound transport system substrate-binding protein